MASRYTFGSTSGDLVTQAASNNSGVIKAAANIPATGTFWSAQVGGTQYTDLVDPNNGFIAITGISTDANGRPKPFQGPAGIDVGWVDFGAGRFQMVAQEVQGISVVAGQVGTTGSPMQTALDARYPNLPILGVKLPATASIADLQTAANSAATFGTRLTAAGTITTSTTLTLQCDADLSALTINYSGTGTAISFGNASAAFFRKTVKLPKLVATAKTLTGWAQVAGSVAVDVVNCYACTITVPYVQNFETGLQLRGASSNGSQQNTVHVGHLDNNKQNIVFTGDSTGWANENHFYGGRCSHSSSEGSQVTGTRHVVFQNLANPVNGNSFYGVSLESPDVVEYHIEAANSQWNTFYGSRFENTGGDTHRRILSSGTSKNNSLKGGAYVGNITQVITSPALPFDIDAPEMTTKHGGTSTVPTLLLENVTSSTAPAFTIMAAGAGAAGSDPSTAYCVKATANTWAGKRSTDTAGNDRLIMDFQNGRLYVGDATAAPVGYIGGSASAMFVGGGLPFSPLANGTQDLGLTSLKWRYVRASVAVQTGALTTAGRPTAATAGAGAMYFDTTLNKPGFSDGTNWRDATGTII